VSALELRPRSGSEIVDAAFRLLRPHYGAFLLLSALSYVPSLLIQLAQISALRELEAGATLAAVSPPWALYLLALPFYGFTESAHTALASDAYRNGEARVGEALRVALRRALPATGALVLVALAIGAGLLLLVVPGLYLVLRLYTTLASTVLDGLGPAAAMSRTWARTRGRTQHMLATVGLTMLLYLVLFMGAGFVAGIATVLGGPIVGLALQAVVTVLAYPMVPLIATLLYYDLRIRSEGYDLEVMSEQLGGMSLGTGASAP
jgi:hypothetical protein